MVVTEDDSAYCWGMADYIHGAGANLASGRPEEFGNAQAPPRHHESVESELEKCLTKPRRIVPADLKVQQAQVGQGHILVLSKTGDVYAWGQGSEGEIGSGVKIDVHAPRLVMAGKGVQDITVGRYHNVCLTAYGLIYSWGAGEHGQLGHGEEQTEVLPRLSENLLDCVAGQIACGEQHTAVLTSARGMQLMQGCRNWQAQEASELRIKQQMVVSLPLGIGARELLSIGPTVRTYVDLFEDERETRQDGTLKGEVREKDKEAKVESRESIIKETKMALAKQVAMQETLREAEAEAQAEADSNSDVPVPGATAGAAGTVPPDMLPSAATATGSDEDEDDEDEERGPVIPQDRIGSITSDVLSGATNQLLQVRTLHARLKSQKELAEESRQRASAQKLEEKRQADLIARVKLEAWAKNLFAAMDQNKDGGLTLKELKDGLEERARTSNGGGKGKGGDDKPLYQMPKGLQYSTGQQLFAAIDSDHDGTIKESEFVEEVLRVCGLDEAEMLQDWETGADGAAADGASSSSSSSAAAKGKGKGKAAAAAAGPGALGGGILSGGGEGEGDGHVGKMAGKLPGGMSMSSKGKSKGKHKGKGGKGAGSGAGGEQDAAHAADSGSDTGSLKPSPPPPGRIHDPRLRAADERVLTAFFGEFQPEFATASKVKQIIRFYSDDHARKSRISPMSNATAGGGDYRDAMRQEYKRQRGVDPWEWFDSMRRAGVEGFGGPGTGPDGSNPNSPVRPQSPARPAFAKGVGRKQASARKQARERRYASLKGGGGGSRSGSPDLATKKAMQNLSNRKALSARQRTDGSIRPHTAGAAGLRGGSIKGKDKDGFIVAGPSGAVSARSAGSGGGGVGGGDSYGLPSGGGMVRATLPGMPGMSGMQNLDDSDQMAGGGARGDGTSSSPRMTRRAMSARVRRERRTQMTRSAHHARSATSAADRVIFKGVQDLKHRDLKAKDHWMALFSPLGPRSDLVRQSGEVLVDSRRSLTQGRGATQRNQSKFVSKVSMLRSTLDKTKTVLQAKRKKLADLKLELANMIDSMNIEEEALEAEHAEEARTSTLLETVHTRLMEASENHEELYSTVTYMQEHMLSMQLLQKERTEELSAAARLYSSLVTLKERGEMMASGVISQVRGLREDNDAVRAQFAEAIENYRNVQIRSRDCAEEMQSIMRQRIQDRKAAQEKALAAKQGKVGRAAASGLMQVQRQKKQMERAINMQQVFNELREQVGDVDVTNPEDVEKIIAKYKLMSTDSQGSADRLVNMALIEDRQQATRRVEMLKNERDGLLEVMRVGYERSMGVGGERESHEIYCLSPISYQLIYRDEPLEAAYENYTLVTQLEQVAESEWGFTDNTLVWSEIMGTSHTFAARRNGWLTWRQFKDLRDRGNVNMLNIKELRCGHPNRTTLARNEAETFMVSTSLSLGAEAEQKRARLLAEVHMSLDIMTMMKPLGTKAQMWLSSAPSAAASDNSKRSKASPVPHASVYTLLFAIARKLGLEFVRSSESEPNDSQLSPRAKKAVEGKLPTNNGDDLIGVLRSALFELGMPAMGSFSEIREGEKPCVRTLIAQVCHHPRIGIKTGWPDHAAVEEAPELAGTLQPPRPALLEDLDAEEDDAAEGPGGKAEAPRRRRSSSAAALLSLEPDEADNDDGDTGAEGSKSKMAAPIKLSVGGGDHDWTLEPEQMEPLSALEELEQTLSTLLAGIATGDRLRKALGKKQEHRFTSLLQQSEEQLLEHSKRHPSRAITKATLRDYCLTGGEDIPEPIRRAAVASAAADFGAAAGVARRSSAQPQPPPPSPSPTPAAAAAADGAGGADSGTGKESQVSDNTAAADAAVAAVAANVGGDMVEEAAEEMRKAELRAAYLAWDQAVTVDYGELIDAAKASNEARKHVAANFHSNRANKRNTVPSVRTLDPPYETRAHTHTSTAQHYTDYRLQTATTTPVAPTCCVCLLACLFAHPD